MKPIEHARRAFCEWHREQAILHMQVGAPLPSDIDAPLRLAIAAYLRTEADRMKYERTLEGTAMLEALADGLEREGQ